MPPELSSLHLTTDDACAFLRLDHGKANEMGRAQLLELEALAAWLERGEVRTLVSWSSRRSSKGTPIFIAGANVTERVGWTVDEVLVHVRWQRAVLARLRAAPVFHVAIVDGVALGWGTEYLLCCDYRLATPTARLGLPETGLGILPGAGGTSELPGRIGVNQALRLGMTGETIDGAEAVRIGLADELVSDAEAGMVRARALAARTATRSPTAVAAYKAGVLAVSGSAAAQEVEARAYEHCVHTGEAAIGRASFAAINEGARPAWGPFVAWKP